MSLIRPVPCVISSHLFTLLLKKFRHYSLWDTLEHRRQKGLNDAAALNKFNRTAELNNNNLT